MFVSERTVKCRGCGVAFVIEGEPPFWCDGCDAEVSSDDMQKVGSPTTTECGFCEAGIYRGAPCPYCRLDG